MMSDGPVDVVIIGAGGFGRETVSLIESLGSGSLRAVGFLDDAPALAGSVVAGLPVLGGVDRAESLDRALFTVSIGNPSNFNTKERIVDRLRFDTDRYVTLIHPTASIGMEVEVGEGTVMLANVVVTHAARIGRHVGIMPNVVITHDDSIADFVIVGAGTTIAGNVKVEHGAYIGAGVAIRAGITIGRGALIGMGAVVTKDVPAGEVWAGVPARKVR